MEENLGTRLNNYGNVIFNVRNKWIGQIYPPQGGFVHFDTVFHGLRAMKIILTHYMNEKFDTPTIIICRYAPPIQNNTPQYIKNVCEWGNFLPDLHLELEDLKVLLPAMVRQETSNIVTDALITQLWGTEKPT